VEIGVGVAAGGFGRVAEGIIFVVGDDVGGGVEHFAHVTVGVVEVLGLFDSVVGAEQASDASGALHRSAEVLAPRVGSMNGEGGRLKRVFGDRVPVVVDPGFVFLFVPAAGGPFENFAADSA